MEGQIWVHLARKLAVAGMSAAAGAQVVLGDVGIETGQATFGDDFAAGDP